MATYTGLDGELNEITGTLDDDTFTGGNDGATNLFYGDAVILSNQHGGNDTLIGGANSINYLYGDAYVLTGILTKYGSDGSSGGDDTLIGGTGGTNYLYGDAYTTHGRFASSGGDDRLVSAANTTDHMWGDFAINITHPQPHYGNDTFAFRPDNGNDFVYDFHQGEDIIELGGFFTHLPTNAAEHLPPNLPPQALSQLMQSFSDLDIETVDTNGDTVVDSVIHFDANNSVTVLGVVGLTAADFDFVV